MKWQDELKEVNRWMETANSNTLMSFNHRCLSLAADKKLDPDRAKVQAYRRMKKKGMI